MLNYYVVIWGNRPGIYYGVNTVRRAIDELPLAIYRVCYSRAAARQALERAALRGHTRHLTPASPGSRDIVAPDPPLAPVNLNLALLRITDPCPEGPYCVFRGTLIGVFVDWYVLCLGL